MRKKNTTRIITVLVALFLLAPAAAWAGSRFYLRHRHHAFYGHHGYHGYGYHYYPRIYGYTARSYDRVGPDEELGALDLNIKPKDTEVYLDGRYIGVTDNYDGFPNHLVLKKGTYELIFYKEGYKTVVRELEVLPGREIDLRQQLRRGESVPPEALMSEVAAAPSEGDE